MGNFGKIGGSLSVVTAACLIAACVGSLVPNTEEFFARAGAESTAGCDAGNASDCARSGDRYRFGGPGTPKDLDEAERYYKLVCRDDAPKNCGKLTDLATAYAKGSGVVKDESRALALFEHACSVNDGFGCLQVGHFHEYGKSILKDEKKAVEYYEKACATNQQNACARMGARYLEGRGVTKNAANAVDYLTRACGNDANGCQQLGQIYRDGNGVAKDPAKAIEYLDRACTRESTKGCHELGRMYRDGHGGAPDDARALRLITKACEAGYSRYRKSVEACAELGDMHEAGRGTPADKLAAAGFWNRSCDTDERSNAVGCRKIGLALMNGDPVPAYLTSHLRTADYAYPKLDRACRLGDKPACEARSKLCAQLKYCR
jgi:uncharacterized protein